ncbi:hypothetical protein EYZ11_012034 [Aspergillus tanneri]|uniref:Reverse transcriptase domain-containing protein n=1 Tax=Aspergillus tanneri TaxID=1220188 RepID=A0A4S3J1B5_9EURO|nr:hypothetical protein EYZ11_012034 [Aspergillus tanneri]
MYDRADWPKIGQTVQTALEPWPIVNSKAELDHIVARLILLTSEAIKQHTPLARPCPYSKRWFTPELKTNQAETNRARRKWQESCASRGSHDPYSLALFEEMRCKRRAWTRLIEKTKSTHWRDFLDKAGEGHLWKAASYMRPRDSYANMPPLTVGDREVTDNKDKAKVLMESFFPKMAEPSEDMVTTEREEIPWEPLTEHEVYKAVIKARGTTAPGEDGIPTLVWKRLWTHIGKLITYIFTKSLELNHYPKQFKRAKIVVLRKPGKPDYAVPGAYRPISLLNTLGKLLEAVVAKRLSFFAESYGLLPNTQFGGRPGRNTEQALLVLMNAIDRAWMNSKVVTLVAFDLKGAFNGVNKTSLDTRLRALGIPTIARRWIQSFMEDRAASIGFDDFETRVAPLENAGLAQGSPLSPILFTFFNSDLVDQTVDHHGGASAFIDDYFRWRAGRSSEENLKKIQEEDIPRIETWAQRTGACFAADKTELIHITRKKGEQGKGQITMQGKVIQPSSTAKLLGVVFDQELRWKEHVQHAVKRATKVNIAMCGPRHLRPGQMRQLYRACVAPVMDYASTVWHDPLKDKTHLRALCTVQRAALIRIMSAFKTVATQTLEVETYTLPTHLRLQQRAQITVAGLHTLPSDHPIREVLERARKRSRNAVARFRFPLAQTIKTMNLERLDAVETIDPKPLAPWIPPAFAEIDIEPDRQKAKEKAAALRATTNTIVYSDASGQNNQLGAAAVALDQKLEAAEYRQVCIGPMEFWSVYAAELMGIFYAISLVLKISYRTWGSLAANWKPATILCDSMSALQAIRNPSNKSGQRIIYAILQAARELKTRGLSLRLQWIPGHCDDPGNDAADRLAKEAVGPKGTHPFRHLVSRERGFIRDRILKKWAHEWNSSGKGSHLRQIDNSLPSIHAQRLYDSLPRNRAYLLTQLRSGHSWLAPHGKLYCLREDDKCECGARETVVHVLVDCPKLRILRQKLRKEVGGGFNNISVLLGAKSQQGKETPSGSAKNSTISAVLDFAEASGLDEALNSFA